MAQPALLTCSHSSGWLTRMEVVKSTSRSSVSVCVAFVVLTRGDGWTFAVAFASTLWSSETDLRLAFEIFDENHDGRVTVDEFQRALASQTG